MREGVNWTRVSMSGDNDTSECTTISTQNWAVRLDPIMWILHMSLRKKSRPGTLLAKRVDYEMEYDEGPEEIAALEVY